MGLAAAAYAVHRDRISCIFMTETAPNIPEPDLYRREITMADGRYLIFYTFGTKGSETDPKKEHEKDTEN